MARLPRALDATLSGHLGRLRQMAFITGPRQVGKTTVARGAIPGASYLDWDDVDDREVVLAGPQAVAEAAGIARLGEQTATVVLDELHKYRRWRAFLKGLFDHYADRLRIVVTGSARLDVFRRGGDSLLGRYFRYRLHPFSVGELVDPTPHPQLVRMPKPLPAKHWQALWEHGGFPEPFLQADRRFTRRWQAQRTELLVREDVRDLSRIQELQQLEVLAKILARRSGTQVNYSDLAADVRVSVDTSRRWVGALASLYFGFLLSPWYRNVARSLRKEPKWFLRDWSTIEDPGARAETFVACHLLKAVETWEDLGLGNFSLHYVRDKERREVDFVVVRDGVPWFLVEAKQSGGDPSPALAHFQRQLAAPHAFQAVLEMPFVRADCFERREPTVVPAATLLSQLP